MTTPPQLGCVITQVRLAGPCAALRGAQCCSARGGHAMTRWQFLTVLTIGAETAIGAAGVVLAAAVWLSPAVYSALMPPAGAGGQITAPWLAALIAGGGIAAAGALLKTQQAIAAWI